MFVINEDLSIYVTRGDIVFFTVQAKDDTGSLYEFQAGDVLRMKIYGKKNAENIYLEKDFPVENNTNSYVIYLNEEDTKIGDVISKATDYWYEVELNPFTNPQTIIGFDEDGAKIFKLFPEGADSEVIDPEPEEIPVVDDLLDMTSTRPVQNQAIARAIVNLDYACKSVVNTAKDEFAQIANGAAAVVAVQNERIDNLLADGTIGDAELIDVRVGVDGTNYGSAGTAVRAQINYVLHEVENVVGGNVPKMGVRLGKFESDGSVGIATTTCITNALQLSAGDKIQIRNTNVVKSVLLYDENGIRLSEYSAMVDNRALLISKDVKVRLYITCDANPDLARLVSENPYDYLTVTHTPHINSANRNLLSDVNLSIGKFHTGLGYEIDDALSIRTNEVVELKKGMVIALHGVGMSMNAFTPNGRAFQTFRSPSGSFGAITNGRSPYEVKEDMSVRLVFNATTEEQAAAFIANPNQYVQIYDPCKLPVCIQPASLAGAATINEDAELVAHCVSACVANGKVYAAYYASEESTEETVANTSIKLYLKEFSLCNPGNGKRVLLCESGQAFENFTQSINAAPYDPQIVKVSNTELRIIFTAHDESGNSALGYITYNPMTGEVGKVFNELQIEHNGTSYSANKSGWEILYRDSGVDLAAATFMCGTCKIVSYEDKYYTILFSCSDGDKGVLVESTDLLAWDVVSFIDTDAYTMCAEASVECENGVFHALIRGENGTYYGVYDGEAWEFTQISSACSRPLIIRTDNDDLVCLYNTNDSRKSFMIADVADGAIIPRFNAYVGSQAHYFDYICVGGNVWLLYSSDVKGIGNGRSCVQFAPIDLNAGLFPY